MMMKASLGLLALAALAQNPSDLFDKAPPDVDASLRERVKAFYQCHIDGTFRKAEKFVADESQEFFYQVQKQRYESCQTLKITYQDNFTNATVTQACKGKWNISGNEMNVTMPLSSMWKRVNRGEWFWYHMPPQKIDTPFGQMDYQKALETGAAKPGLQMPSDMKAAGDVILRQVAIEKVDVTLSSYEKSSDTVTLTNNSTGPVKLQLDYEKIVPGFKAELSAAEVAPGAKAILRLTMDPKDRTAKPSLIVRVYSEPLFQQFPVKITFAIPPEIEKLIPKK